MKYCFYGLFLKGTARKVQVAQGTLVPYIISLFQVLQHTCAPLWLCRGR